MRTATPKPDVEERRIGFIAPEQIHGALKQIIGWAEMNEVRPSDKTFTEREFLQGLIAGFWETPREQWESIIKANAKALKKVAKVKA
jgi:hypothetical protein